MRFVDSNVFLHAFLRPRRELSKEERHVKEAAKEIVREIEGGEGVAMSTVHLSEVVNIIESGLSLQKSLGFLAWAISSASIDVYPTDVGDYGGALSIARESGVSANDALAYLLMKEHDLDEVYSFDRHFDLLDVTRLPV